MKTSHPNSSKEECRRGFCCHIPLIAPMISKKAKRLGIADTDLSLLRLLPASHQRQVWNLVQNTAEPVARFWLLRKILWRMGISTEHSPVSFLIPKELIVPSEAEVEEMKASVFL